MPPADHQPAGQCMQGVPPGGDSGSIPGGPALAQVLLRDPGQDPEHGPPGPQPGRQEAG